MDVSRAVGTSGSFTRTVMSHMSARSVGSGDMEVLSTPWMIAMMESASREIVQGFLPTGYTTVGTRVDVRHSSPLPVGALITVTSRLVEARDRKMIFEVAALSGNASIGSGTHERALVNTERFVSRLTKGG